MMLNQTTYLDRHSQFLTSDVLSCIFLMGVGTLARTETVKTLKLATGSLVKELSALDISEKKWFLASSSFTTLNIWMNLHIYIYIYFKYIRLKVDKESYSDHSIA